MSHTPETELDRLGTDNPTLRKSGRETGSQPRPQGISPREGKERDPENAVDRKLAEVL